MRMNEFLIQKNNDNDEVFATDIRIGFYETGCELCTEKRPKLQHDLLNTKPEMLPQDFCILKTIEHFLLKIHTFIRNNE